MKCDVAQTRMLELERPDRPTPPLRAHLARCPACQEWFHQLVQMERKVLLLPVPPSTRREEFLRQVLSGEPLPVRSNVNGRNAGRSVVQRRERGLRKMALATGLAAGLVLLAVGLVALQPTPKPPVASRTESLVQRLLKHDLKLAAARTSDARLDELFALADALHGETRSLAQAAGATDDLATLAKLYQQVVSEGIVTQVKKLPQDERERLVESVAGRLEQARHDAAQTAADLPAGSPSLNSIANAARKASEAVRGLAKENQP